MAQCEDKMPNESEPTEHGQALVEFALLVTFLAFLVMAVLAFGLIFTTQISLLSTAKGAARIANLNDMRVDYCANPSDHLNDPIYDAVMNNLGNLPSANIHDIVIFLSTSDGKITPNRVDVVYANGSGASGCYDYNHDGACDCSCPSGSGCVHDFCANTFTNQYRCNTSAAIGVEVRYDQEVLVPLINAITGDVIILPARVIMHVES